ncbi:hypothetical protein EHSB41UT_04824 [Parendozoicomonas haliclonae]|uniref:Uncharacterized protein n=1 Tax=Parendozoicomonas haliclonae TaxID=1960125 RepID=A0A1X7AU97_9GAMM|nr:hypothetical protein EHSB41UT_04824 [Parendozoicomonas haliclonae]
MQLISKPLFSDFSVKFDAGNLYGLIGANGCCKFFFFKQKTAYEMLRSLVGSAAN